MKIEDFKITNLFDLDQTIAKDLLEKYEYPWEVLPHIEEFILELGPKLPKDEYELRGENVWVHKTATIFDTAYIKGPAIIGKNAEIRQCAFIRGKAIIGENTVVGNSTEVKNSIFFNEAKAPHYNYVGDSILGYKSHMGAGSITSNVKSDKTNVQIKVKEVKSKEVCAESLTPNEKLNYNGQLKTKVEKGEKIIETNLRKVGAFLGDGVEVGCNSVLNPGTIIGKNTNIYPLSCVRGVIPENSIYKNQNDIVEKH